MPVEYQSQLNGRLIDSGVSPSEIEFVVPEKLSAEHFKPSPTWQGEREAVPLEDIFRKVVNMN